MERNVVMEESGVVGSKRLAEVCNEWLSRERLTVKRSTYSKYYDAVKKHIEPGLGHLTLKEINSTQINLFIYDKLAHGRLDNAGPLASKTVRDIYTILKSIIKYAEYEYDMGSIARNTAIPKGKNSEFEILSKEEQQRLEEDIQRDIYHPRKNGILLCLYTGLRIGEICALRWRDIDFDDNLLYVRHTLQRITETDKNAAKKTCIVLDAPKSSNSVRTIPLTGSIICKLQELRSGASEDAFVLTCRKDFVEPRNYQYFFHTYLKSLGIREVNFHILRHTFASRCVESGFDIKTLSEILGHSNTDITLNYYIHTSLENKRKQMELLHL